MRKQICLGEASQRPRFGANLADLLQPSWLNICSKGHCFGIFRTAGQDERMQSIVWTRLWHMRCRNGKCYCTLEPFGAWDSYPFTLLIMSCRIRAGSMALSGASNEPVCSLTVRRRRIFFLRTHKRQSSWKFAIFQQESETYPVWSTLINEMWRCSWLMWRLTWICSEIQRNCGAALLSAAQIRG